MDHQELIKRINELAKKAKTTGLDDAEKAEQKELRARYIEMFRGNLKSQLDSIVVVDEKGNETRLKDKSTAKNDAEKKRYLN